MKSAIKAMRIYVKTVELGSMSRAAVTLGISTSGVSQQIRKLEQELEVNLLHRNTRKLTLTEAGEVFFRHSTGVLQRMTEAERDLDMFKQQPQGALRLFAPVGFAGSGILSQPLQHLLTSYEQLKLDLIVSDDHIDMVAQRIDIALRVAPGALPDSSLIARHVGSWDMMVYASRDYLLARGIDPQGPLLQSTFASQAEKHTRMVHQNVDDEAIGFLPAQVKVNNMQTLTQLTLDGLGVAILPEPEVRSAVAAGRLVRVMPDIEIAKLNIFAVTTHKAPHPAKISAAMEAIEQAFTRLNQQS